MTTVTQAHAQQRNGQPEYASAALALRDGQDFWDAKQIAALQQLGIKDASNADLAVFLHYCQKTGLDPFSRQIYMLNRRTKVDGEWVTRQTIQVAIDGYRVIASRAARRDGVTLSYSTTSWYDDGGQPYPVWVRTEPPAAASVIVYRDGHAFPGVARFASFAAVTREGQLMGQWATMPDHMIAKCAEAQALRKAFPHDLGGTHTDDEMAREPQPAPRRRAAKTVTSMRGEAQIRARGAAPADVIDAEIVADPGQGDAVVTPEPAQNRPRPLGKTTLGRLRAALGRFPFGSPEDGMTAIGFLAGRDVPLLEALTQDEAVTVTKALDSLLERAGGDPEEAVSALWAAYRQHLAEASQDAPDGTDG